MKTDDDAVGSRALAEIDQLERSVAGIEPTQRAVALARKPHRAIGGRRDVARAHAGCDRIIFDPERALLGHGKAARSGPGVARNSGSGGFRNWRQYIALPRAMNDKVRTRKINLEAA